MLVDEAHGIGTLGPGGRGALADFGLEEQVDVIVGPLDNAIGSQGAFVACDELMARYLASAARTFRFASAPAPPAAAGALAALDLLESRQPSMIAAGASSSEKTTSPGRANAGITPVAAW